MNARSNIQRRPGLATASRRRWRMGGSILVNTAIALSLIVITLIGTELGYLFFLKRELQKTADLAALAGAQVVQPDSCANAMSAALANAAQNLPGALAPVTGDSIACGRWDPVQTPASPHFTAAGSGVMLNAVQVTISRSPALLLPGISGNQARTISVQAMAAKISPRAALTIRTTLLAVDTTQSPLLNSVFSKLLGGSVSLSAVGWDGLVKTQINLLSYLNQLAIELNTGVGQYDKLLQTDASVGQLIQAAIDVLQRDGGTAEATVNAIAGLLSLQGSIPSATPLVKIGDFLQAQTGTTAAGLDLNLQVFQLMQAMVQVANGKNAVAVDIPISIPGIVTVSAKIKVIEPPQISAVGNPELAKIEPDGPNGIYVRTAQIRALVTADLPALSLITGLLDAVTNLLTPVTDLLNSILSLNLQTILQNILCVDCTQTQAILVPDRPVRISIGLNAASANTKVIDFNCTAPSSPSLTVSTQTSVAEIQIGQILDADEAAFFSSGTPPPIQPIPLLDIQTRQCTKVLGIPICDSTWTNYSRTGLKADTLVGATTEPYTYVNPPALDQAPLYYTFAAQNLINSVATTLGGLQLQTYQYSAGNTNHFGNLIGTATQLVQVALQLVQTLIQTLLAPLLDPIINFLLANLGIDLAQADVGANLSCASGAQLVY